MELKRNVIDILTKLVDEGIESQEKVNNAISVAIDVIEEINKFTSKHDLALECGSEWLYQSDKGQVDSLELVGNILDGLMESK